MSEELWQIPNDPTCKNFCIKIKLNLGIGQSGTYYNN